MKALLFIPQLDRGGPDRVFAELAAHLPAFGIGTEVLVQEPGGDYWDLLPADVPRVVLPSGNSPRGASKAYPVGAFAEYVRATKPDVVLCTLRSLMTAAAASMLGKIKVPVVTRPANHLTRNSMELLRKSPAKHGLSWLAGIASLHAGRHLVCQSQDLYDDFRRYGVPASRMTIIGNPIELPQVERIEKLKQQRQPGAPSLVAVGRLMPQKGFDLLIESIALLRTRLPQVHLGIFGEGPDRSILETQIRRLNLEQHVRLNGFVREVDRSVAGADFLVSSSRYEGFPNVVLEALSLGTPVIATACPGGTRELVVPGETGWLCAPNSASALADAIEAAVKAPILPMDQLRGFIERHYSTAHVVGQYAGVLRRAAGKAEEATR
ncbi:glycosyltransferase [Solimonas sp. SE-A11]|uniref:glycosyltransferase n=1 Tax=Solimonas sp. SE-A11 TaxID=3054954 RepID=UPI00259C8CA0|nr:glycosyltransferase [Solimonas sp. SE-A11]MDM4769733.1 glycosyltransferase [Solimonas sp. SE-A11]